ncbi:hypothetical protein ACFQU2_34195 [Siccirubricoccus deserti]
MIYFTHSLLSCWNHGNAHFLRGVLRELSLRGHDVLALEPASSWSLENLLRDHGQAGLEAYRAAYPDLRVARYATEEDIAPALDGAEAVVVHEWNEPWLVAALGRARRQGARFTLLFHDTHHRAVSDPDAIRTFDLDGYDGVLAFGEALAAVYRRWGWGRRVHVWHEAADTRLFHPPRHAVPRDGLVWIGIGATANAAPNWRASCCGLPGPPACRSISMACATRRMRCTASPRMERGITAGWRMRVHRRSSRVMSPRCMCHAGSTWSSCPAFRPSGSSRRWPAASSRLRALERRGGTVPTREGLSGGGG